MVVAAAGVERGRSDPTTPWFLEARDGEKLDSESKARNSRMGPSHPGAWRTPRWGYSKDQSVQSWGRTR